MVHRPLPPCSQNSTCVLGRQAFFSRYSLTSDADSRAPPSRRDPVLSLGLTPRSASSEGGTRLSDSLRVRARLTHARFCMRLALVISLAASAFLRPLPVAAASTLVISEVAPWSSGNSPLMADWFEVTNTGPAAVDITGWRMDDDSNLFANSVALTGITSIGPGESVIFIETASPSTTTATFRTLWFGANPPAGLHIGSYSGSGVGLSTSGDQVHLFDA